MRAVCAKTATAAFPLTRTSFAILAGRSCPPLCLCSTTMDGYCYVTCVVCIVQCFFNRKQGAPEEKFVSDDGQEAVFDGDTHRLLYDPRYMPTYNYVNPMRASDVNSVSAAASFVGRNVGHFVADVVPYALLGNVRRGDARAATRYNTVMDRLRARTIYVTAHDGDTPESIAAANGVSVVALTTWNPAVAQQGIVSGQQLRIIKPGAAQPATQ
jgi:hypothetical protein